MTATNKPRGNNAEDIEVAVLQPLRFGLFNEAKPRISVASSSLLGKKLLSIRKASIA
jgi:hypothetical protein